VAAGIVQDGAALISEGFMKILHPENFHLELENELCSSESSKTMMPLLGGEEALRRNQNPADCKEEKEHTEEAGSLRDVGCPAESAQKADSRRVG
jgi:hypothetical protein